MATIGESLDRCMLPAAFWQSVEALGLRPPDVLRCAHLPATLHLNRDAVINTQQFFAIWTAIEQLSGDPAFGIKMVHETSTPKHKLAFLAATFAIDFRDGLNRLASHKRLCSPDQLSFEEQDGQVAILCEWPTTSEPEPALSVDANFAMALELGRRGTGQHLLPVAVEYRKTRPASQTHHDYYGCPIRCGAPKDRLIFRTSDLALPFIGHNPEMLEILTPALSAAVHGINAQGSIIDQVKAAVKTSLASGRPDIAGIARQLGLSERTLQRRIRQKRSSFRALLAEARQELCRQLLAQTETQLDDVAALLGYGNINSFYRAFRKWEEATPFRWRQSLADSGTNYERSK